MSSFAEFLFVVSDPLLTLQGAPHLALDSDTLRIWNEPPQPGRRFGFWKLGLVGLGAGAQLVTRKTPYQVRAKHILAPRAL